VAPISAHRSTPTRAASPGSPCPKRYRPPPTVSAARLAGFVLSIRDSAISEHPPKHPYPWPSLRAGRPISSGQVVHNNDNRVSMCAFRSVSSTAPSRPRRSRHLDVVQVQLGQGELRTVGAGEDQECLLRTATRLVLGVLAASRRRRSGPTRQVGAGLGEECRSGRGCPPGWPVERSAVCPDSGRMTTRAEIETHYFECHDEAACLPPVPRRRVLPVLGPVEIPVHIWRIRR
jgi:hypothetical protein